MKRVGFWLLAAALIAGAGCFQMELATQIEERATGTLLVPVQVDSGTPPDSGFDVVVDDTLRKRVHPPDTAYFTLVAGDHTVELTCAAGTDCGLASASILRVASR